MLTKERLEHVLRSFPAEAVRIDAADSPRFVVMVISSAFEGKDEGKRQAEVWEHVYQHLPYDDARYIEFIFTDTPAERAAAS